MKICSKCKNEKEFSDFSKWKYSKDGFRNYCKECSKNEQKKYREKNKDTLKEKSRIYYYENNDKIKVYLKSDDRKKSKKEYYERNKNRVKKKSSEYYYSNVEKVSDRQKEYRKTEKYKKSRSIYLKNWSKSNKHIITWRQLLYRVLSYIGKSKENKTIEYLGYSAIDLKVHIENLFQEGMTWQNHGEWHIDHIKPVSSFDINTEPSEINALSNLRPLWALDNLSKGKKL